MSAVDHFGNPVLQKTDDPQDLPVSGHAPEAVALSENAADVALAPQAGAAGYPESRLDDQPSEALLDADTISLPVLGTASVARHQRNLFILMGLGLLVLALVAAFALRQSNTVAQQLTATGQSLMQSQRLAKRFTCLMGQLKERLSQRNVAQAGLDMINFSGFLQQVRRCQN